MSKLLKGVPAANSIFTDMILRCNVLKKKGVTPSAVLLRIGSNASDTAYEKAILKSAAKVGIQMSQLYHPTGIGTGVLLEAVETSNVNDSIHGALIFRPLPKPCKTEDIANRLRPEKDIDGMTEASLASVFLGKETGFPPCTAESVLELLDYYRIPLDGIHAVVIGRSNVIGKPLSLMLQRRNATVTMCHSHTKDLAGICRNAELIVSAAGRANLVTPEFTNPDQIIIDVGMNVDSEGKLCGDVDFASVKDCVKAITPVPGGVGALTTAILCRHIIIAAERTLNK